MRYNVIYIIAVLTNWHAWWYKIIAASQDTFHWFPAESNIGRAIKLQRHLQFSLNYHQNNHGTIYSHCRKIGLLTPSILA